MPPRTGNEKIYGWEINSCYIPLTNFNIATVIDTTFTDPKSAPIDTFISKNKELNKILLDSNGVKAELDRLKAARRISAIAYDRLSNHLNNPVNISPVIANLILLGHISAVESYFRELFRRIILIDNEAQQACREKSLSYGAALVHDHNSLPDALLEGTNFSGKTNVEEALRTYIGIKGNLPDKIKTVLLDYSQICQLRHCIIHRFGKLGVNNAMKLDWHALRLHVEKPIKLDYAALQNASQICLNVVKEINLYTFQALMMRQIAVGQYNNFKKNTAVEWKWIWRDDKKIFKRYYDIFFSNLAPPANANMKAAYTDYQNKYINLP